MEKNNKKSNQPHNDESKEAEGAGDVDPQQRDVSIDDDGSSLESTSYSESIGSASSIPCQDELAKLAEIVIDFDINFNKDKSKRKEEVEDVLKAEIALRNTSGGVIRINSTQKPAVKDRDDWMKDLYEKRKTLLGSECGEKDSIGDILDIKTNGAMTYIFVRKSSVTILTDDSHLRQRSEERNYKVSLYSRICELLNRKKRRCVCANNPKFHTSFRLDETLSYETMTEEHKLLNPNKDENLAKRLCDKLSDNVVAFANTQGGTVYFGIEDTQSLIKGQKIKDNKEKDNIHRSIVKCLERKFWALDSGEQVKPKAGEDYYIKFFPVDGAGDDTYVIAVHICAFPGTGVFKQKPKCSVLDQENQIVNMEFKEWLSLHKPTSGGSSDDYIDHLEAIKSNLTDGSNQLNDDLSQEENKRKYRRFLLHVAQHATTKWQEIGENLDVKHNKLESLKADYNSEGIEEQAYQMLVHWRQSDNKPTLEKLLVALIYTKLVEVANDVSGFLTDKRSRGGQKVEEKLLNKITNNVTDVWKFLGRYLGIDESTIHAIKKDHHGNTRLQARQMLFTWKQSDGSHATTGILINALHDVGKADVAREVQEWENKNSVILEDNLN